MTPDCETGACMYLEILKQPQVIAGVRPAVRMYSKRIDCVTLDSMYSTLSNVTGDAYIIYNETRASLHTFDGSMMLLNPHWWVS